MHAPAPWRIAPPVGKRRGIGRRLKQFIAAHAGCGSVYQQ
jgi:hypothetical protein